MWFLLLASASAATCTLNGASTACNETSVFTCVDVCAEYRTQGPCSSFAACEWTTLNPGYCRALNASFDCSVYTDATSCSQQPACFAKTSPCKFNMYCTGNNTNCNAQNSTQCASLGNGCSWKPQCFQTSPCSMTTTFTQGSCTSLPGCFWLENTYTRETVEEQQDCLPCFTDPSLTQNTFLRASSQVGQTCNTTSPTDPTYLAINVIHVAVSGSNCTGGAPAPPKGNKIETCSTIPTRAPSTAPTTAVPTATTIPAQTATAAGLTASVATLCLAALLA